MITNTPNPAVSSCHKAPVILVKKFDSKGMKKIVTCTSCLKQCSIDYEGTKPVQPKARYVFGERQVE
jgi:hypothetical protein